MSAYDIDLILETIPYGCSCTPVHAPIHLIGAMEAKGSGDRDQAVHDLDLAGRLLICAAAMVTGDLEPRGDMRWEEEVWLREYKEGE